MSGILKAVILAGGRGKRIRPLTDITPKPMLDIKGRPFLYYQLELLKKNKLTNILVCAGYLKHKIIDYFGDGSRFGLEIEYSLEDNFLGTAGALKRAEDYLSQDFILLYGDSYLPIDYRELIRCWEKSRALGLVVCYDNQAQIAKNNIYLEPDGLIRAYCKHNPDKMANCVEAGVSIFKKQILELIPEEKNISLEEEIFPFLIKEKQLRGYVTSQRYYDIGTPKGLKEIGEALL